MPIRYSIGGWRWEHRLGRSLAHGMEHAGRDSVNPSSWAEMNERGHSKNTEREARRHRESNSRKRLAQRCAKCRFRNGVERGTACEETCPRPFHRQRWDGPGIEQSGKLRYIACQHFRTGPAGPTCVQMLPNLLRLHRRKFAIEERQKRLVTVAFAGCSFSHRLKPEW